jgi:hypothetical protein
VGKVGESWGGIGTGNGMIPSIFRTDSAVAVSIETGHGLLGEEGEGFFEDCILVQQSAMVLIYFNWSICKMVLERDGCKDIPFKCWLLGFVAIIS